MGISIRAIGIPIARSLKASSTESFLFSTNGQPEYKQDRRAHRHPYWWYLHTKPAPRLLETDGFGYTQQTAEQPNDNLGLAKALFLRWVSSSCATGLLLPAELSTSHPAGPPHHLHASPRKRVAGAPAIDPTRDAAKRVKPGEKTDSERCPSVRTIFVSLFSWVLANKCTHTCIHNQSNRRGGRLPSALLALAVARRAAGGRNLHPARSAQPRARHGQVSQVKVHACMRFKRFFAKNRIHSSARGGPLIIREIYCRLPEARSC